jgi:hypothetical protein
MKNTAVSKEVALDELEKFVNFYSKKPFPKNKLEETYPDVLDGIMDGYLSFDEKQVPTYKLRFPIKTEDGTTVVLSEVNFKTRIKPSTKADLAKGLHPQNEVYAIQLNMLSYFIDQSIAMIDKLHVYDYDTVSQVAAVFP